MSEGIEVYDAAGNMILSNDSRLVRHIGSVTFSNMPAMGYSDVAIPGAASDGTWIGYAGNTSTGGDIAVEFHPGFARIRNVSLLVAASGTVYFGRQ